MEKQVMQEKQEKKVYQPANIKVHQLRAREIVAESPTCPSDCEDDCSCTEVG